MVQPPRPWPRHRPIDEMTIFRALEGTSGPICKVCGHEWYRHAAGICGHVFGHEGDLIVHLCGCRGEFEGS